MAKLHKSFFVLKCFLLMCPVIAAGQITVAINSGNPALPFPQFMDYVNPSGTLQNLAKKNPAGVTHAEMEKTIREAYQIMMNRAYKPGGAFGGIDYVCFHSNPFCTEGDGFAMLAAAAMGDKTTFDGLWLWIHDNAMNKTVKYSDGKESTTSYIYSRLPGWTNSVNMNSLTEGDEDIGLALLLAYYQWGEFMGIQDAGGKPISYKNDAIALLQGMTDTLNFVLNGLTLLSGDIGLDGYLKSGDAGPDITDWASDSARAGVSKPTTFKGPAKQDLAYAAPSYFHAFADFLVKEDSAKYAWNIKQFCRAEASCDWLMGQMLINEKMIPFAGSMEMAIDNKPKFSNFSPTEDFRCPLRTVLNGVWYGNPASAWDPVSHQVKSGASNSYEQDIGKRYARFLWDSRQSPWNKPGLPILDEKDLIWGTDNITGQYTTEGEISSLIPVNWVPGAACPSAVVAQDFNLMAELYRTLEITWGSETSERYIKSTPQYFHEWFRLLGMLVLSGNYLAPHQIRPSANLKVYLDVDKTCAFKGGAVTYTISYRNYGSRDAGNAVICDTLPADISFVECSDGGTYDQASRTVKWTIGAIPGFTTSKGIVPTAGTVNLKTVVTGEPGRQIRNKAVITCGNGSGWTSNEFPNTVSSIMKRNHVDIIQPIATPQNNFVEIAPLHGGRPGVRFSYLQNNNSDTTPSTDFTIQLFHDAHEPYINYANYRVSYFLYDETRKGIVGQKGDTNGWIVKTAATRDSQKVLIRHENLSGGSDSLRKWNQRIILQFSDSMPGDTSWNTMATTYTFLKRNMGILSQVHRGLTYPLTIACTLKTSDGKSGHWADDWSWNPVADSAGPPKLGYPIGPDFTDPSVDNKGTPVPAVLQKLCANAPKTVDNILVEEWDGYTWRRIYGGLARQTVGTLPPIKRVANRVSDIRIVNSAIEFSLSGNAKVRCRVFDVQGRTLVSVPESDFKAGVHRIQFTARLRGRNVGIINLKTDHESVVKKVTLVR